MAKKNAASHAFDQAAKDAINMARVEAGSAAKVRAFLGGLESDLIKILADNKDLSPGKTAKLEQILKSSQDAISQTYEDIATDQAKDLKGVASYQSKSVGKVINAAIGVDVMGAVLTENQLSALVKETFVQGHPAHDWWSAQSDSLKQRFTGAVQQGYALGEDIDQIARRIRGTKATGFTDGVMQTSKREAEALARTAVQTISNSAKMASFEELKDTIKGIEWVATLDTRTTLICRALDGKVWTFPGLEPVGHDKVFPGVIAHWNCRSTQIPVLRSWEELSGKKIKALDGKTYAEKLAAKLKAKGMSDEQIAVAEANARASMDGQASGAPDMQEWLQKEPDTKVKQMLGPSRAKLLSDGRLTVSDLTDQSNRPLTVAQLQAGLEAGSLPVETEGASFAPFDHSLSRAPTATQSKAIQNSAAKRIAQVMDDPKASGNAVLADSLSKVQAAEPSLSPAETLAKAEEQALAKKEAAKKAATLANAKKKLLADESITPAQQAVIDGLADAERKAFQESIADARAAKQALADKQAAEKALADAAKAPPPSAIGRKAVGHLVDGDPWVQPKATAEMKFVTNLKKKGIYMSPEDLNGFAGISNGLSPEQFVNKVTEGIEGFPHRRTFISADQDGSVKITTHLSDDSQFGKGKTVQVERVIESRKGGGLRALNMLLSIPEQHQAAGLGKTLSRNYLDIYDHADVRQIDLHANIDVGGYAWFRYGFLPETSQDLARVQRYAKDQLKKIGGLPALSPASRAVLEAALKSSDPKAMRAIAALSETVGDEAISLGKKLLLGSDWNGAIDLSDPESYNIYRRYMGG